MQSISQRSEKQCENLARKRRKGWKILQNIKYIILEVGELDGVRHYIEQPQRSLSWKSGPLVDLFPFTFNLDGCRWDMRDDDGFSIRKGWRITTNDAKFAVKFERRCNHPVGSHRGLDGGRLVAKSAGYPRRLCE